MPNGQTGLNIYGDGIDIIGAENINRISKVNGDPTPMFDMCCHPPESLDLFAVLQQMPDQAGLAGTEKASNDGSWNLRSHDSLLIGLSGWEPAAPELS